MAASSASHAVSGSQGLYLKIRDAPPPADSAYRHESAAESAAGPEQVEVESTEAMLQRIHRSLRKPISQPKPGLHTHSQDAGHAPRLESGSEQDSGKWWPHHHPHTAFFCACVFASCALKRQTIVPITSTPAGL